MSRESKSWQELLLLIILYPIIYTAVALPLMWLWNFYVAQPFGLPEITWATAWAILCIKFILFDG